MEYVVRMHLCSLTQIGPVCSTHAKQTTLIVISFFTLSLLPVKSLDPLMHLSYSGAHNCLEHVLMQETQQKETNPAHALGMESVQICLLKIHILKLSYFFKFLFMPI